MDINFDKKTFSKLTREALLDRASDQNLKKNIIQVMDGVKLKVADANFLLKRLIQAIIVGEEGEERIFEETDDEDGKNTQSDPISQSQTQNTSEHQNQGEDKNEDKQSGSRGTIHPSSQEKGTKFNTENVCRFYKNGNCKFKKDCRKEHPKFCQRFTKHGLKSHNINGCDSQCGLLHPNACRESLRSRECSRDQCNFYHIKGTKFLCGGGGGERGRENDWNRRWNESGQKRWREETRREETRWPEREERRDRCYTLESSQAHFLDPNQDMGKGLIQEMRKQMEQQMDSLKTWVQAQLKPRDMQTSQQWLPQMRGPLPVVPQPAGSGQENWRQPNREEDWMTLSQQQANLNNRYASTQQ